VREEVLPEMEGHGAIDASIIDEPGFPKSNAIRSGVGVNVAIIAALI
jgi:hypothetical protein